MALEVRGASMAPSKACRPQSTKLPQPEICNVSWADALDFLRLYLLGQQTRLSFPTPLQGLSESAPGRALRPKLAWDRGQKRNSGALPGPRSRNMAKCPAPDRTQVCRHPPTPSLALHRDSAREWVVTWIALRGQVS